MVATQNKFLENIIQVAKEEDASFVVANASVNHHPIIYCSQTFSEELGYTRNEITRKDAFLDFLYGEQTSEECKEKYEKAIRNKEQAHIEMLLYGKGAIKHWYLVSIRLICDTDGEANMFLLLFNDITHLKPAILDSPIRQWKKAVRKLLNKPDMSLLRKDINKKKTRKKTYDMESIIHKMDNIFIPCYGGEKIEVPKFVILHTLPAKTVWDCIILCCILYTSTAAPVIICFELTIKLMTVFDTIIDVIFLCDIGVTMFTTYVNEKGDIVTNLKQIRMTYLKSWFAVDLVASLPYSVVFFFDTSGSATVKNAVKIIKILKIVRLVRLLKVGKRMRRYSQMKILFLGVWILLFCLIAHWMACIWYVLAFRFDNPAVTKHSWLAILADISNEPYDITNGEVVPGSGPSYASLYVSALYYTMSSLTTCGFGNIAPNTSAEKFFGCVTMLMGCVLYAFIFGQVTNIISQMQKSSNTYAEQINQIKQFNEIYKVPEAVAARVENYFSATWTVTKGTNEEDILGTCPRDLQQDLCLHMHSNIFESHSAFSLLDKTALRILSRYFATLRTSPGDKIIYPGESVDTIFFVASGALEVKHGSDILGLIGPGDAFGKRLSSDEEEGKSLYGIEACSFGTVHYITCEVMKEALQLYPEEFHKIKYELVLSFDITRQIKILTKDGDVFTTELPESMKEPEKENETNVYLAGDDVTALEYTPNIDVLAGMSELKGELRRETERMNSKMGVVETQMRLILKLLRRSNKVSIDPEIGTQLDELMSYGQDIDDDGEWYVADSQGWKERPPSGLKHATIIEIAEEIMGKNQIVVPINEETRKENVENLTKSATTKMQKTPRSLPTVPTSGNDRTNPPTQNNQKTSSAEKALAQASSSKSSQPAKEKKPSINKSDGSRKAAAGNQPSSQVNKAVVDELDDDTLETITL